MIPEEVMGADLVVLSAVAPISLSPKSNILPGLVFEGQVTKCLATKTKGNLSVVSWPHRNHIVSSRSSHFQRSLGVLLAFYMSQVSHMPYRAFHLL